MPQKCVKVYIVVKLRNYKMQNKGVLFESEFR